MNSTFILLDDLRNVLREEFHDLNYRVPVDGMPTDKDGKKHYRPLNVYIQNLPAKQDELGKGYPESDVPYLLIKLLSGEVSGESPRKYAVRIGFIFTVYDPDDTPETGAADALGIHDRIISALSMQRQWANDYFIQELPIKSAMGPGKAEDVYDSRWQTMGPYNGGVVMAEFYSGAQPQIPPKETVGLQ